MRSRWALSGLFVLVTLLALSAGACQKKTPPVTRPIPPPPPPTAVAPAKPPAPAEPVKEPVMVPAAPITEDKMAAGSLDEINRNSPLKPVFFALDSADVVGRRPADPRRERRSVEEEPDLGRSRSRVTATSAARPSTTSRSASGAPRRRGPTSCRSASSATGSNGELRQGIPVRPGHTEEAWAKNRRDHFVVTRK